MQDTSPIGLLLQPHSTRGRTSLAAMLAAAVEVFSAGTQGRPASVAAVAKKVGLSPAAIYQYFPDRQALLTAAVEQDVTNLFDEAIAQSRTFANPISSNVFGECLAHCAPRHLLAVWAIVDECRDVSVLPRVQLRVDECIAMLVSEIKALQGLGTGRTDIEVHQLAEAIMHTSLFITLPDLLAGTPDSARSKWFRYLSAAAIMKNPRADDISIFLNGHQAPDEHSI